MDQDSVRVDPEGVDAGLRTWQAAVELLRQTVSQRAAAIESAEAMRPWGGDTGGRRFGEVYAEGAGPSRDATQSLATQLEQLGRGVSTAVAASLASDEVQAAALAPAQQALDPR